MKVTNRYEIPATVIATGEHVMVNNPPSELGDNPMGRYTHMWHFTGDGRMFHDDELEFKEEQDCSIGEDEKIRKVLICLVQDYYEHLSAFYKEVSVKDMLTWLEKQGNLMKALQISNARIGELIEKNYYLKEQFEKQGEQSSAWSEEDELMLEGAIDKISDLGTGEMIKDWLKSLKDRVKPQQEQEWSEEDEELYKEVLTDIIYAKNDLEVKECLGLSKRAMEAFNWFSKRYKSIRPQNTWKPSDEQIEALWEVYKGGKEQASLATLYLDLKKLRDEQL